MLFGKYVNNYYIKYGLFFLFGVLALILVDFFQLEIPEIIGDIIKGIQYKTLTKDLLKEFVIKLFIIAGVMFIGRFMWRICIFGNGIRIESDLRNRLFRHMETLSIEYYSENKVGALMALYTNDLQMIRHTFGMGTIMLVDALCLGTLALIKMFKLNAIISIISLTSLAIITTISTIAGRYITKRTKKNFEVFGRMSDFVQENFSGISVVKAFVLERIQKERFEYHNKENMDSNSSPKRLQRVGSTLLNTCGMMI